MHTRKQRGFTMVEVLVALVLCTIAMVGVIALYRTSTSASSFSRRTTEATVLAQAKLEDLRLQSASVLTAVVETTLDETGKVVTGAPFTRSHTVIPDPSLKYFDVVVTVSWTDEGNTRSVTLRGRRNVP